MSKYYNPKNTRNIYRPESPDGFKLSRSKIELFMKCKKCFYMDRRLGVGQPPGFPFALNSAVDALLKKEFDIHRKNQTPHELMVQSKIDAVPFQHEMIDEWRENFKGIQYHDTKTGFLITGAVDDIWINKKKGELHVVDYKSTSKPTKVTLDAEWQDGYKRQMEIYQWLLRKIGFNVSDVGYFVYCNGKADREIFGAKMDFDMDIISYTGSSEWVESTLLEIKQCLDGKIPRSSDDCDFCAYRKSFQDTVKENPELH